jgi:hypothetical protein
MHCPQQRWGDHQRSQCATAGVTRIFRIKKPDIEWEKRKKYYLSEDLKKKANGKYLKY